MHHTSMFIMTMSNTLASTILLLAAATSNALRDPPVTLPFSLVEEAEEEEEKEE